jgi:hypothetical protein
MPSKSARELGMLARPMPLWACGLAGVVLFKDVAMMMVFCRSWHSRCLLGSSAEMCSGVSQSSHRRRATARLLVWRCNYHRKGVSTGAGARRREWMAGPVGGRGCAARTEPRAAPAERSALRSSAPEAANRAR